MTRWSWSWRRFAVRLGAALVFLLAAVACSVPR